MAQAAKTPRQNRTLTVGFRDEATYAQLLGDTQAGRVSKVEVG